MNLYDDDMARDAEAIADRWADDYFAGRLYPPITEERAARWLDEAPPRPKRYTGRRRANEDGTPSLNHVRTVADLLGDYRCLWPDEHAVDYPDRLGGPVAWIQHRKTTGECLTCWGWVPR